MLLKTATPDRKLDVAASYEALTEVCAATADKAGRAELVSDCPNHLWSLPASRVLAIVHSEPEEGRALLESARLLRRHHVAVVSPRCSDVHRCAEGRAVTFWQPCGKPSADTSLSAWVTALIHRIDPAAAPWLREHDPFAELDDDPDGLDEADRAFLREHTAQLREEWDFLDWPTPDAVILGGPGMAPVHDDGVHVGLLPRRPLRRGHREWDLVAARWRSELLTAPREDHRTYADTYLSYQCEERLPGHPYIGAWSGYRTVRDVVVLTAVMDTVRRARFDAGARRLAARQVACLRGAHPAPWNWRPR